MGSQAMAMFTKEQRRDPAWSGLITRVTGMAPDAGDDADAASPTDPTEAARARVRAAQGVGRVQLLAGTEAGVKKKIGG